MDKQRYRIYVAALLEAIPIAQIKTVYNDFVKGNEKYIRIANEYASAKKHVGSDSVVGGLRSPFMTKGESCTMKSQELSLNRSMFPNDIKEKNNEFEIQGLWTEMGRDFDQLDLGNKQKPDAILNLLERYASTIVNPSGANPHISWFDYVKVKAGLALCIYDYLEETKKEGINNEDCPILIYRADLSGIQSFISSIASKNASKNLKGRSFYLQILSDSILRLLLKETAYKRGNVLYASGGNFFLVLANTPFVVEKLEKLENKIAKHLFDAHKIELSVVVGYKEISQKRILEQEIDEAINELFEEVISVKKKQKYAFLLEDNYEGIFQPFQEGGSTITDVITGEEISNDEDDVFELKDDLALPEYLGKPKGAGIKDRSLIKKATAQQIFLGHGLKDLESIVFVDECLDLELKEKHKYEINPCSMGMYTYLITNNGNIKNALIKAGGTNSKIEKTLINLQGIGGTGIGENMMFYGGNKVPLSDDGKRPKYFHEMSGKEGGNFKRLGVLRMDIDGLGNVFKDLKKEGVTQPEVLTFSCYSAISRHLDWFFKGYLNTLWKQDKYRENTQIIYSGGDDLFILGKWDLIIQFAEEIRSEFEKYTCGGLSLSGGVAVVNDKFPVMKASVFAANAEHLAKGHKWSLVNGSDNEDGEKDSLTLFGKPLHWKTEYPFVKRLKDELLDHLITPVSGLALPKSILGKLNLYYRMMQDYERRINKGEKANPRWIWIAVYDLSRFEQRLKGKNRDYIKKLNKKLGEASLEELKVIRQKLNENESFVKKMRNAIFTNGSQNKKLVNSKYHYLELLHIAVRWAELSLRSM